jgi:hypothetical protein
MLADMSDTTKWFHKTNKDDDDDVRTLKAYKMLLSKANFTSFLK